LQLVNEFFLYVLTDLHMKCPIETFFSQKALPTCSGPMEVASAAIFSFSDFQIASFGDNQAQQDSLIVPHPTPQASSLRPVAPFGQAAPAPATALFPALSLPRFQSKPPRPLLRRRSPPLAPEPTPPPLLPCGASQLRAPWRICAKIQPSLC